MGFHPNSELVEINGEMVDVFVVKRGKHPGGDIVIELRALTPVHFKMLAPLAERAAARKVDLLDLMKSENLDNGVNALKFFRGMFRIVPCKPEPKEKELLVEEQEEVVEEVAKPRRGRKPRA